MIERTLVLIKPDAMKRNLASNILKDILSNEINIVAAKKVWVQKTLIESHYNNKDSIRKHGPTINSIFEYLSSGPILAIVFEGVNAVENVRKKCGDKSIPKDCEKSSIRYRYGSKIENYYSKEGCIMNLIHSSSNTVDAINEIKLWFGEI